MTFRSSFTTGLLQSLTILSLGLLPLSAAPREWQSSDGSRSFKGELISRDHRQVTIRSDEGRVFILDLAKLHAEDRQWLDKNHPAKPADADPIPDNSAVFDTLHFGDDRATVERKLRESSSVEMAVSEVHLGRFGLNGTFRTKHRIGGLHGFLYFDWSPSGLMRETSIHTETLQADSYNGRLLTAWKEFITLMTTLYGRPVQDASYPKRQDLEDGSFLASHLWRLEGGGSALLGSAREGNGYMIVVRFTQESLQPVRVP
jgi:hypothetical protein